MHTPIVAPTVGFIANRAGLTCPQFRTLTRLLVDREGPGAVAGVELVRRGNETDADTDFARVVRWMDPRPGVVVHSCLGDARGDWSAGFEKAETPTDRNRAIVDGCEVLIACPREPSEEPRSGTWATIRYARTVSRAVVVVYPDGSVASAGRTYWLVVDRSGRSPVAVFVGEAPAAGVLADRVVLESLPLADRATGPLAAARPVLGQSRENSRRFREFPSRRAVAKAGFVPAGPYRVCDTWRDYHFPWPERVESIFDTDGLMAAPTDGLLAGKPEPEPLPL